MADEPSGKSAAPIAAVFGLLFLALLLLNAL